MSKKSPFQIALIAALFLAFVSVLPFATTTKADAANATAGQAAPTFTLTDTHGKSHKLSDYAGKYVVLEWFNMQCPFVKKHYDSGNMQKLQKDYTKKGVIWLSICSSADGKPGYFSADEHNKMFAEMNAAPSAILIDADGTVGHLYGAKSTPDMFVINPKGIIVYAGAIDDTPDLDTSVDSAKNYVKAALDASIAGKPVAIANTKSYGCSVKYE